VSHSPCTHRDWVDSQLLVVGSQIVSLTPGLSFNYNLCYRCLNGSCEAIFDIYSSRPFQQYKEHLRRGVLTPAIELKSFRSPGGLPSPHFMSVNFILTLFSKWGCDNNYFKLLLVILSYFISGYFQLCEVIIGYFLLLKVISPYFIISNSRLL
jgi:hypothetical protein